MPSASDRARRLAAALVLPALVAGAPSLAGCTSAFEARAVRSPALSREDVLRAGVKRVDITPAPGLSLFGHGPEGRVSRGILTRLRCHAFVLSSGTEAVALVPCDIGAPSLLLQRAVARELATRNVPLGADRVVLTATHTHAGPAHLFGAGSYAGPLSTRKPQGTSQEVVDFLAKNVAGAIADAWAARRPARLGWRHDRVFGLTKNRSMEAFALGASPPGATGVDPVTQFVDTALRAQRPAQAAVDPTLSLLRIDALDGAREPLGALVVFGVHPTGVSNLNDLYHGDLFGMVSRAVFDRDDPLCGDRCPPIALMNGLSGDVSPVVDFQGPREARRWARDFGGFVRDAWESAETSLDAEAPVALAYREVELTSAAAAPLAEVMPPPRGGPRLLPGWVTPCACLGERTCGEPPPLARGAEPTCACLCDHASVGASASGGAEDGRTAFSFIDGWREGSRVERRACHAPKIEVIGPGACEDEFPHRVPMWSVRLGGALLVTFPAEVTTVAGKRAVARVERELAVRATERDAMSLRVVPATLAGDWLQYVTTEEEYASQQYEGGSTLWGPASARLFARQAGCLAGWLVDRSPARDARDATCRLGQDPPFTMKDLVFRAGTADVDPLPRRCDVGGLPPWLGARPADLCPAPGSIDDPTREAACRRIATPATRDGERGLQMTFFPPTGCATEHHVPRAAIVDGSGKVVDDDEGDGFELRAFNRGISGRVGKGGLERLDAGWLVSWFPDERARSRACAARQVRLRVTLAGPPAPDGGGGQRSLAASDVVLLSEPFDPCR